MCSVQDVPRLLLHHPFGVRTQLRLQHLLMAFTGHNAGVLYVLLHNFGDFEDERVMAYLHQLHGDLIYFPAGV